MARYLGSNKMSFKKSISKLDGQKGFTLIEIIIASLILTLIVAAVVQYHTSVGVSKGQQYYLKAVQTARTELEKLRALYEFDADGSFAEFDATVAPPASIFLFKFKTSTEIEYPDNNTNIFRVYYKDHSSSYQGTSFLKPLGSAPPYAVNTKNSVKDYHQYYEEQYNILSDDDDTDRKTFTYFTYDTNPTDQTDSIPGSGQIDASVVIIDDMGSPVDPEDDLLGNIGWWVEDVSISGTVYLKKITFALQFWYPGQVETEFDPEVIVLKTTLVKP